MFLAQEENFKIVHDYIYVATQPIRPVIVQRKRTLPYTSARVTYDPERLPVANYTADPPSISLHPSHAPHLEGVLTVKQMFFFNVNQLFDR